MEFSQVFENANIARPAFPKDKVGILGGTFDPIHNGHIDLAQNICNEFFLKKIMFIPSANPPHKQGSALSPASQRLDMAELGLANQRNIELNTLEIDRGGLTYTIDTMRELAVKYCQTDFYFIIGSDSLFDLNGWKEFSSLARITKFICMRRQEHDALSVSAEVARLKKEYFADIYVSAYCGLYVSSSFIRSRVANGKSISAFVPPLVEEYIFASGLYKQQG